MEMSNIRSVGILCEWRDLSVPAFHVLLLDRGRRMGLSRQLSKVCLADMALGQPA